MAHAHLLFEALLEQLPVHAGCRGAGILALVLLLAAFCGCSKAVSRLPASEIEQPATSLPGDNGKHRSPEEAERPVGPAELTLDLGSGMTMELVLVPAGEFMMGSRNSAKEVARKANSNAQYVADEHPRHRVRITKPFYMGKHEVTQAQYERVMGTDPSKFKGADLPVEQVSWKDATEFCRKLFERTGKQVRLPTEAEWEYVCRAGTTTPFNFGERISTSQANYNGKYPYAGGKEGEYRQKTTPVGSFRPNAWGLYDMHGNVWEWCADWYDEGYYTKSPTDDPTGPANGTYRVIRGGCWGNYGDVCRSAYRDGDVPTDRDHYFGLRVAVSPSW